jgi:hypothetical protein
LTLDICVSVRPCSGIPEKGKFRDYRCFIDEISLGLRKILHKVFFWHTARKDFENKIEAISLPASD